MTFTMGIRTRILGIMIRNNAHNKCSSQCHSAEPEDVVEKLLEMTENIRSQVQFIQNTRTTTSLSLLLVLTPCWD